LRVEKIEYQGVSFDSKDPLPGELAQREGQPLDPAKVTASVRRLFASGRYRDIRVDGERKASGVTLIYAGTPRYFVGRVSIEGVKSDRLSSLLEYATKLNPGKAFAGSDVAAQVERSRQQLPLVARDADQPTRRARQVHRSKHPAKFPEKSAKSPREVESDREMT